MAIRDAIAAEPVDSHAASLVADLAEALLLARGPAEAEDARDRVSPALAELVDRGELSRTSAHRLWARLRMCGPDMQWPLSWLREASARRRAVRDS